MRHRNLRGDDLHSPSTELVENDSGSTIEALRCVKFNGMGTTYPKIIKSDGTDTPYIRGVTQAAILTGASGYMTAFGFINNIDTSAWTAGTKLYSTNTGALSSTVNGNYVAEVIKQHASTGIIFVNRAAEPGAAGSQIYTASGAPSGGLGSDGDFYINTATSEYYKKISGSWVSQGSFIVGTLATTSGGTGLNSYTTGDMLYASATNTLSKRAAGNEGDTLRYQGGVPVTAPVFDPSRETWIFEDFISNQTGTMSSGITVAGAASGLASNAALEDASHPGVYEIQTGSSSATDGSYMGWSTSNHAMVFSNGVAYFEVLIRLSRLSTSAQEYFSRIGWYDDTTSPDATTDGLYFLYDRAANGDVWAIKSANNGTRTTVVTSEAVVATTWIKLAIQCNSAGTLATYYVNGVSIGTISTNIPTGIGRGTGAMVGVHKTVGTGTNTTIAFDYMFQRKVFATPR